MNLSMLFFRERTKKYFALFLILCALLFPTVSLAQTFPVRSPYLGIPAENPTAYYHVTIDRTRGFARFTQAWGRLHYKYLNFDKGTNQFTAAISNTSNTNQTVDLYLDNLNGTPIGTITVPPTGSWNAYKKITISVAPTTGLHDLFIVGKGNGISAVRMDWFVFNTATSSPSIPPVTPPSPAPTPAAPPLAKNVFTDPDFGTPIMRLTDSSDGPACNNAYSYWPSFNLNSTRVHVYCQNTGAILYSFDPVNFHVTGKEPLFRDFTPDGTRVEWIDSIWSGSDPDIIYAHDDYSIWSYNVATHTYTKVMDLKNYISDDNAIHQMSKSIDDKTFAFTEVHSGQYVGFSVYSVVQHKLLYRSTSLPYPLDEVQLDKTGKYLVVKYAVPDPPKAKNITDQFIDLSTAKVRNVTDGAPDFAPGHSDNGTGTVIGYDRWNNTIRLEHLDNPQNTTVLYDMKDDWTEVVHVSDLSDTEKWAVVSTYNNFDGAALHRAIFLVATDGSGRVVPLAHHNAVLSDPSQYDIPHASISRDGKFVLFTSSMGNSGRWDAYIIKIPTL